MPHQADDYLRAFHAAHPGATSAAYRGGWIEGDGRSSYDALAALPPAGSRVLDLGCGDGYLLELLRGRDFDAASLCGVDMSAAELAAARRRQALDGVKLLCESASQLSSPAASVDCVVSHLAFMLMTEVEAVAAQVRRVLRPGGTFATVVGGGPGDGDAFELFLELFRDVYAAVPDETKAPRIGDKRTRHAGGMREIFPDAEVTEESWTVRTDAPAEQVWDQLVLVYEMFVVGEDATAAMRDRFLHAAEELTGADGVLPCSHRMRLITVSP